MKYCRGTSLLKVQLQRMSQDQVLGQTQDQNPHPPALVVEVPLSRPVKGQEEKVK